MEYIELRFSQFLEENSLIDKNDRILIAFSGGPDSVFLFYLLNKFKETFDIEIALFHLNHMLRGDESDMDENFSKNFADEYNLKFFLRRENIGKFAEKNRISVEEAGRKLRYAFLNDIAKNANFNKIATAHHFDDQVETFFLSLFRGKSLRSFEGIRLKQGNLIRPILIFNKNEILEYLSYNNLDFIIDSSNTSNRFLRNRIRNILVPFIEDNFSSDFKKHIVHFSGQVKDLNLFIEEYLENFMKNVAKVYEDNIKIPVSSFPENGFIRLELFKKIFSILGNFNYSGKVLTELEKFIKFSRGKFIFQNIIFYKEYDYILVTKNISENILQTEDIKNCGKFYLDDNSILTIFKMDSLPENFTVKGNMVEFVDYMKVKFPLRVRYFQNGDRFQPLGLRNRQKLKDFFINNKIPKRLRNKIPLLIDAEDNIIWVVGYRISEKIKIDKNSKEFLKFEYGNNSSSKFKVQRSKL